MLTLAALPAQAQQVFKSDSGDIRVETVVSGLVLSVGPRLSPGRTDAGDRARRQHADRNPRRQALATAERRAEGHVPKSGRSAGRDRRPRFCEQQYDLFLLFRSGRRRRADGAGARQARCRRDAATDRCSAHLPAGGSALPRSAFRLPHRAGAGRQSVPHHRRSRQRLEKCADPRQPSRQDDPDRARRFGAEGQSVCRTRRCQAGDLELWPSQQPGRDAASRHRQIVDARAWPAGRRRDQHSGSRQELRLAGDRLRRQLRRRQNSRGHEARPAWNSRSGNGRR